MIQKINNRYDVRSYFLGAVLLFPILKYNLVSILIIVLALVSLGVFFYRKESLSKISVKHVLIAGSYSILLFATLFYSSNFDEGVVQIQHGISTVVFPLIILIFYKKIDEKELNRIIWVFFIACFLAIIYTCSDVFLDGGFSFSDIKFWDNPFRHNIMGGGYLDIHPSYFSMWILFTALFFIHNLFYINSTCKTIFFIGIIVFLVVSATFFTARGPLMGFFMALIFTLIVKIKSNLNKTLFVFSLILISLLGITKVPFLKSRFVDEFEAQKFRPPVGNAHTSTNIRVGIYKCAFEISKENPWTGIGIGDVMARLNLCYGKFHTRVYEEKTYNSHNEYLNILLSAGIIGFSLFLLSLIYQIYLGLSSKSYLYVSFLILIMTCFLFENVLSRMHGAVFYGLFNSIFIKKIIERN